MSRSKPRITRLRQGYGGQASRLRGGTDHFSARESREWTRINKMTKDELGIRYSIRLSYGQLRESASRFHL